MAVCFPFAIRYPSFDLGGMMEFSLSTGEKITGMLINVEEVTLNGEHSFSVDTIRFEDGTLRKFYSKPEEKTWTEYKNKTRYQILKESKNERTDTKGNM